MSKGSIPRQVNAKVFGDNFDRIFRKPEAAEDQQTVTKPDHFAGVGNMVHTNHPLRHYDRTCPACQENVTP